MKVKNRINYLIGTIIFTLCFVSITNFPASAESITNEQETEVYKIIQDYYDVDETEAKRLYEEAQKAQEFYEFDSNGNLYFDEEGALSNGVDEALVEEITAVLGSGDEINSLAASCKGLTLWDPNNSRAYFDSCGTDELVIALAGVGTLLAIVGIIAALQRMPVVSAFYEIAALLIGYGATVLAVRNKGCGVFIYWTGPNTGIHSQTIGCS
ncbi:hypothetical protein [Cytobacillus massiliigabonensis]|uniref:hypothetical protein n=1 Tax=Cytobacillus massiliigabonensis TaxID=1871011 RepID=UPI000C826B15|nr:hypothetical protein [Cytobacillus massiliigabonensis]